MDQQPQSRNEFLYNFLTQRLQCLQMMVHFSHQETLLSPSIVHCTSGAVSDQHGPELPLGLYGPRTIRFLPTVLLQSRESVSTQDDQVSTHDQVFPSFSTPFLRVSVLHTVATTHLRGRSWDSGLLAHILPQLDHVFDRGLIGAAQGQHRSHEVHERHLICGASRVRKTVWCGVQRWSKRENYLQQ